MFDRSAEGRNSERTVIVCLSTIPSRMHFLPETIRSLETQTYPANRICIFLPAWSKKEQCLYPQLEYGQQYVCSIRGKDQGSITKIYPIVDYVNECDDHHTMIINLDDDAIYHPRTIESLLFAYDQMHSPDVVLGFNGWIMNGWHCLRFPSVPIRVDYVQGCDAILYPMHLIRAAHSNWLPIDPPEAKSCDDIWIASQIQYYSPSCRYYIIPLLGGDPIWKNNHKSTPADKINSLRDNITIENRLTQHNEPQSIRLVKMIMKNYRIAVHLRQRYHVFQAPDLSLKQYYHSGFVSFHITTTMMILILLILLLLVVGIYQKITRMRKKRNKEQYPNQTMNDK